MLLGRADRLAITGLQRKTTSDAETDCWGGPIFPTAVGL
jgi:hypothetical protein